MSQQVSGESMLAGDVTPQQKGIKKEVNTLSMPMATKWLPALISSPNFFLPCKNCAHRISSQQEAHKAIVNYICLTCGNEEGVCQLCIDKHHNHHILQIRRSSYHDVVRVQELSKLVNTEGIQTYIINSSRVVFLKERPQNRVKSHTLGNGIHEGCLTCKRNLHEGLLYCSLGCKVKYCTKGKPIGDSLPHGLDISKHASLADFQPVTPQIKRAKRKLMSTPQSSSSQERIPLYHRHRRKSCPRQSPWQ